MVAASPRNVAGRRTTEPLSGRHRSAGRETGRKGWRGARRNRPHLVGRLSPLLDERTERGSEVGAPDSTAGAGRRRSGVEPWSARAPAVSDDREPGDPSHHPAVLGTRGRGAVRVERGQRRWGRDVVDGDGARPDRDRDVVGARAGLRSRRRRLRPSWGRPEPDPLHRQWSGTPSRRRTVTDAPAGTPSPSGIFASPFAAAVADNTLLAWSPVRATR